MYVPGGSFVHWKLLHFSLLPLNQLDTHCMLWHAWYLILHYNLSFLTQVDQAAQYLFLVDIFTHNVVDDLQQLQTTIHSQEL